MRWLLKTHKSTSLPISYGVVYERQITQRGTPPPTGRTKSARSRHEPPRNPNPTGRTTQNGSRMAKKATPHLNPKYKVKHIQKLTHTKKPTNQALYSNLISNSTIERKKPNHAALLVCAVVDECSSFFCSRNQICTLNL